MANVVARTLRVEYGQTKTYMTASGLSLDVSVLGTNMTTRLYLQSKNGYAIFNSTALDVLYPNAKAHPVKADSTFHAGLFSSNSSCYIALEFDGTEVQKCYPKTYDGQTPDDKGLTASAILNSTKSSTIRYHHYANSTVNAVATSFLQLTLYFNQYSCSANAAGNGVTSASVSDATPWDGDSVTFTATLKSGATWHGWYKDAACTQLVSTSQSYTVNAADLTLYAYATVEVSGTGIYLKQNGAYKQAQAAYKKVNGVWVQQTDIATLKTEMQNGALIWHQN